MAPLIHPRTTMFSLLFMIRYSIVIQILVGIGVLHLYQLVSGRASGMDTVCIVELCANHNTSIVLFEIALGLVTDVVPQTFLHDANNFMISTLICVQLTTGESS